MKVADMADDKFLFVCLFLAYMLLHKVAGIMAEKKHLGSHFDGGRQGGRHGVRHGGRQKILLVVLV